VAAALILAHQGGWDETLMVLAPLVLIGVLLKSANRRAKRLLAEQRSAAEQAGPGPPAEAHPAAPDIPPTAAGEG
jgi:hypothetical protein